MYQLIHERYGRVKGILKHFTIHSSPKESPRRRYHLGRNELDSDKEMPYYCRVPYNIGDNEGPNVPKEIF